MGEQLVTRDDLHDAADRVGMSDEPIPPADGDAILAFIEGSTFSNAPGPMDPGTLAYGIALGIEVMRGR